MLDRWQVVRTSPDEFARPGELADLWDGGIELDRAAPVATVAETDDDHDWWHRTTVDVHEPAQVEFDGLTFPATVFVDDIEVARCVSMFLPVRVHLEPGQHEIAVCFESLNAWLATRRPRGRWRSRLAGPPGLRWARTTLLGRAPVYGDVPVPVGFWRPATLGAQRAAFDVTLTADPQSGRVEVTGSGPAAPLEYSISGPSGEVIASGRTTAAGGSFTIDAHTPDPQVWWPRGYGDQPLYRLRLESDGEPVVERAFGFRSLEAVDRDAGFGLRINGIDVFCRGATWFPPDPVALTVDEAAVRRQVSTLAESGANMLRIVGGLVPEQPEFWEICAELGVLVWQDAMVATFDPPDDLTGVIVEELTTMLRSVSGNPALAVVSGGSETLQQPEMLGLDIAGHTMDLLDVALPEAVAEVAAVPYVRASPAPPDRGDDLAIRPDTGVAHWFGVGGYLRPVADVRSAGVRFAAECLAFANPPSPAAVERHFGSTAVAGHDPRWKAAVPRDRGASWDFEDVRDFYVRQVFDEDPAAVRRVDPERYLDLGRLAITEAMLQCFGFWRRAGSDCRGALVLSGKDACPGAGWGLIDVDGAPKAALQALRRVWAPQSVVVSDDGLSGIRVDVHNDGPTVLSGELNLAATDATGRLVMDVSREIRVPAHSSLAVVDSQVSGVFRDLSHAFRFGSPTADAVEAVVRFADHPRMLRDALVVHPRGVQVHTGLRAVAEKSDGGWELQVSSEVALRYVCVEAPGWQATDNYFHLPAGRPHRVRIMHKDPQAVPSGTVGSLDAYRRAEIETPR
ncbi:MAG: beta-mannosidase [Mycobacterium sp.]